MCANLIKRCECGLPVEIELMEEHKKEAHTEVNCKFCKKAFNKKKLEEHQKTCNFKPKPCRFCEMEIVGNDLKEHENICGAKTEVCYICKKPVTLKDLDNHVVACSINENERIRNEQLVSEKKREEKIRKEKEEERKRIEEKNLEERKKLIEKEEKRKLDMLKLEEEKKKEEKRKHELLKIEEEKRKEDKRKQEEKSKEEKRLAEKKLEEDLKKRNMKNDSKSLISSNKFQPKQNNFPDINHHNKNPNDLLEINKNYVKESILNKKDNNITKAKPELNNPTFQPKPAKDYINNTFKDPRGTVKNETKGEPKFDEKKIVNSKEQISSKYLPKNKTGTEVNVNMKNQSSIRTNITSSTIKDHKPSGKFDLNDFVEENDTEDLIRKLQLQEDQKLAEEL
jgi:hypothetical protein